MSEYFLADRKAEERAKQRAAESKPASKPAHRSQDVKVTLLGDFLFPSVESPGCDPYNSTQGKAAREAWRLRRDRR
jgi:hypothetical protein